MGFVVFCPLFISLYCGQAIRSLLKLCAWATQVAWGRFVRNTMSLGMRSLGGTAQQASRTIIVVRHMAASSHLGSGFRMGTGFRPCFVVGQLLLVDSCARMVPVMVGDIPCIVVRLYAVY